MAGDGSGNGKDSGGKVVELKCPMLQVIFDPRTCAIEVTGNAPSLTFSRHMLLMALENVERAIAAAQQPQIEVARGPFAVPRGG